MSKSRLSPNWSRLFRFIDFGATADTLGAAARVEYFSGNTRDLLPMQRPNVDDDLTLLTDFGKTEGIVVEVLDNPATEEGVLLKVMARGPFEQGQQVWIVGRDRSKVGATVEDVFKQTIDSEVTLSTVLPA